MEKNKFQSVGTWKRYKLGQAQFTDWLKQTADKVRPKNDANAKSADGRVHLNQLEGLAKDIANGYKPEDIPYTPIVVLRDVVDLRKQSSKFYARVANSSGDEDIKAGNKSHEHAIKILDRVLKTLENAVASVKHTFQDTNKDQDTIANMFELLHVQTPKEETVSDEEDVMEIVKSKSKRTKKGKKPRKTPKKQVVKTPKDAETDWIDRMAWVEDDNYHEDDEFDCYMLIYCFFVDFNTLRDYIAERWCDYFFDNSINSKTMAVIHNAACELFYHMEADLLWELKMNGSSDMGHYETMMSMLFIDYGIEHVDYEEKGDMSPEQLNEKIWTKEADWVAFSSYAAVEKMLSNCPPGKTPMVPRSQRRAPKYGATSWTEFGDFHTACAMELYLETAEIKALKKNEQEPPVIPAEPELILDFQHVLRVGAYPSSVIFSLQLFLDMRHIMEEKVEDAFNLLQQSGQDAARKLQRFIDNAPRDDHRKWIKAQLKAVQRYILEDFMYTDKKARLKHHGIDEDPEQFSLLKTDPVWSGLLDFRTQLILVETGFNGLHQIPGFLRTVGLYHFMRQRDESLPRWSIMDHFIELHPVKALWDELLQQDRTIAAVLKNDQRQKQLIQWAVLVLPIDIVQFFLYRYGDEHSDIISRKNRSMEYVLNLKEYIERKQSRTIKDVMANPVPDMLLYEGIKKTSQPMQHLEVLRVLAKMTDHLVDTVFKMDYMELVEQCRVVCAAFQQGLDSRGFTDNFTELGERDDAEDIVGTSLRVAIGNVV
ncbi:hypothetical protein G7046_g1023 [Stylonectria norvegica]|nr:hypothetical protein G7046_g1023 [Stylonectria norvegica]